MYLFLAVTILILFYYVLTKKYEYFKYKKVPHLRPTFLLGNYGDLILQKKMISEVEQDICKKFPGEQFIGAYYATEPVLIPMDPEFIKLIMSKDFYYFNGRDLSEHNGKAPGSLNLVSSYGDRWRVLRQNMTPLFSSAKMKNMFHRIEKCSHVYESMLDKQSSLSKVIEVRDLTAMYSVDCISACSFGIDTHIMLDHNKENPFAKIACFTTSSPKSMFFKSILRTVWPSIFFILGFTMLKTQYNLFSKLITFVMCQRNYESSGRTDLVNLMLCWKHRKHIVGDSIKSVKTGVQEKEKVSLLVNDDLLVAQCYVFFTAGFESSSNTLNFTLFELAKHQSLQDKVMVEIDSYLVRHGNKLEYECTTELPYLGACIDEALRLYPIVGTIPREQMEDYTFPNGVSLKKGLRVHIPVLYLHYNPKYYENPFEYRPERFIGEEKKKIVPYTYMPFGAGPRTCIGMRLAKMIIMAGLITMLKKYRLELADDMPTKLKFEPTALFIRPGGEIHLKFIERDGWENRVFVK